MSNILAVTYEDAAAVTASDSVVDPAGPFAGLLVTAAGTVKITTGRGTVVTMAGSFPVGTVIPIVTKQVWSTGTSATVYGLLALPFKGKAGT